MPIALRHIDIGRRQIVTPGRKEVTSTPSPCSVKLRRTLLNDGEELERREQCSEEPRPTLLSIALRRKIIGRREIVPPGRKEVTSTPSHCSVKVRRTLLNDGEWLCRRESAARSPVHR